MNPFQTLLALLVYIIACFGINLRPFIVAGSLADHVDRKALLAVGATIWSVATLAMGQADGYAQLW